MKFKVDKSEVSQLGICEECGARFLGTSRLSVMTRLAAHGEVVHPSSLKVVKNELRAARRKSDGTERPRKRRKQSTENQGPRS